MPSKYTVKAVLGDGRKHPSKYGEMIGYTITVTDETGVEEDVEWSRKPTSPAPSEGMQLEADGFWDPHPNAPPDAKRRFKGAKVLDADGNPIGGSSSGSGGSYGARQDDPLLQARIARSVAQKTAGEFVAGMAAAGVAPDSPDMTKWAMKVVEFTELFEQHLGEIGREAEKSENKTETGGPPF